MDLFILFILSGLSIAPFVFSKLPIWTAQGLWGHLGILVLWACSFLYKPYQISKDRNIPLIILFAYTGVTTALYCYQGLLFNRYDIRHFFIFYNFFIIMIFYNFILSYFSERLIVMGKLVIKWTIMFNIFIAIIQLFGLGKYFYLLYPANQSLNNMVTGMIGNGTHLSGFLAMLSPVLFTKKREDNLLLILLALTLCFTGTTKNEPALSGFIILIGSALFYSFYSERKRIIFIIIGVIVSLIIAFFLIPKSQLPILLSDNSRFFLWKSYLPILKDNFIFGIGLGSINIIAQSTPVRNAYHLHLEYYHFLVELGIVGLILIINVINSFFHTSCRKEALVFKTIIVGFLISCCFTYPAHLWYSSMFAIFAYGLLRGDNVCIDEKTNQG